MSVKIHVFQQNDYVPLWGTCMGFQLLNILTADDESVLQKYAVIVKPHSHHHTPIGICIPRVRVDSLVDSLIAKISHIHSNYWQHHQQVGY
jgi:hypothetical protein